MEKWFNQDFKTVENCDHKDFKLSFENIPPPHYAKKICIVCGHNLGWAKKPENENKRPKNKYVLDIAKFHNMALDKVRCFYCSRLEIQLGIREGFEVEHIVQLVDGGIDELENLQILCTACHKMKNWMITYIRNHLTENKE
ncbi:MAG: hypothetical protein BV457_08925 [Thermoplasmata archaeon M9B1D]|nr:MAG: hypothetical protein BV457_08925 [Thermoplasmata archaeon M9B1D]